MTKRTDFKPPEVLDFRRDDRREANTIITVHADYKGHMWICCDDIEITGRSNQSDSWTVEANNHGATDGEHDTAVMFRFALVGVTFRMASGGRVWLNGFVAGDDPGTFRVPPAEWNQLEGATKCTHERCRGKDTRHLVVDEGRYIPPPNDELFDTLRGLRIEIVMGSCR